MAKLESGLTKQEIVTALMKAPHAGGVGKTKKGEKKPKLTPEQKLTERLGRFATAYGKIGTQASQLDPLFYAKLVAYNHGKGEVRDAKVALPVYGLQTSDPELLESNLAHLADLQPREFLRATELAKVSAAPKNVVRRLVTRYLRDLEAAPYWESVALRHKDTLKTLYTRFHVKPHASVNAVLFKGNYSHAPRFAAVATLSTMPTEVIANTIRRYKFGWLTVRAALGKRLAEPDVLAAVIGCMTPTELVTNMKALDRLKVKDNALTRAALEAALGKAATRKGPQSKATLKASVAAAAVDDEVLAGKLQVLQEKQLDTLKGIEGNWLILADKSSSMSASVDAGKQIAALLARLVKGKVDLVFFNTDPMSYDVSGKTLAEIEQLTRHERATGGTTIGCGLDWLTGTGRLVDGIVIVSDGGDNRPATFANAYKRYVQHRGNEPTVYFYKLNGDSDVLTSTMDMEVFDLRGGVDYTSLPNLVQSMRVGKYSLLDEIMSVKLRTLDEVLDRTKDIKVLAREVQTLASA